MEPAFREFARLSDVHGLQLLIVSFPLRLQVEAEFIANDPQLQLAELSKRIDVPLLDTLPLLRAAHAESEEPLFFDHAHHTPRGQKLLARAILGFIRDNRN